MGVHGAVTFFLSPDIKRLTVRDTRPRRIKKVEKREPPLEIECHDKEASRPTPPCEASVPVEFTSSKTPFVDCADFADRGGCQTVLHQRYEGNRGDILRCKTCGRTFSSRRGDISFKSRLSEEAMDRLVTLYNQGESIRRVAKVLSLNRGTVRRYYRLLDEQKTIRP